MLISRATPVTLALALALVGCTGAMPDSAPPTITMGGPVIHMPAIHRGDAPPVLFVGMLPQQIIGDERPHIVLDGWN